MTKKFLQQKLYSFIQIIENFHFFLSRFSFTLPVDSYKIGTLQNLESQHKYNTYMRIQHKQLPCSIITNGHLKTSSITTDIYVQQFLLQIAVVLKQLGYPKFYLNASLINIQFFQFYGVFFAINELILLKSSVFILLEEHFTCCG